MDDIQAEERTDLRTYLRVLGRRKAVVAVTVVVVVVAALAYSLVSTPRYTAEATVLVPEQQASAALNISNSQLQASDALNRALADDLQFAQGDAVKAMATKTLGYKAKITVGSSSTADVLTFTATSTRKAGAAAIANAYSKAFIAARRADQVSQYSQQVTALQSSIAQLQKKQSSLTQGSTEYVATQQSITSETQSLQQAQAAAQIAGQYGATVVDAAVVPTSPSSPHTTRNALLALLVGLILGLGLAFLAEFLDEGIRSREDAETASGGLPIVGLVPLVDSWKAKGSHHLALIEDPKSTASEAYRTLRTAIQFMGLEEPREVIAVTSSIPGEGKTTTVANLAVSFARAGQQVAVVSCDLRRPRLHTFFGDSDRNGLTSVLLGHCALIEALHPVEGEPNLRVMPSGPVPPNPAEILSLDRVREVVEQLSKTADVVLLDCPPVLPVTDTLLMSRLADGLLVVASADLTSKRDLARTFELLRQVKAPLLGTILNRVPVGAAYSYGYAAYGGYEGDDKPEAHDLPSQPGTYKPVISSGTLVRSTATPEKSTEDPSPSVQAGP